MEILWGQVLTQLVAFLLFLWVLKVFAWKPVMEVLEQRRQKIQSEFDRIHKLEKEVEQMKEDYQSKIKLIEEEARDLRLNEVNRGKEIAEKLQEDARQMIAQEKQNLEQQLVVELAKAKVELRDFVVDLSIQATSKLINETLDDARHRRMVDEYIRHVSEVQN